MSGRILIIDGVATNRILLKVKLLSAQYQVTAVPNQMQAQAVMDQDRPDLIIVDLADRSEDRHAFCKSLRDNLQTSDIAILGTGAANTARARLAALDVGVKDLLSHPIDEAFLLARVRSLLRLKNVHSEIWVRDTAGRALGFEEEKQHLGARGRVQLLTASVSNVPDFIDRTARALMPNAQIISFDRCLAAGSMMAAPDLYVIDTTGMIDPHDSLFRLSADLRSRRETRLATQLVIVPPGATGIAAAALDLGADDVAMADVSAEELIRRCTALLDQKRKLDKFHTTVKDGLRAAVTDPLTGLYNRRYADPYLHALSEKSLQTGQEFAIMMIDIDHFKAVNDTYGHAVGDHVLTTLAARLRDNLRGIDLIARVGGEEFLVALPQTDRTLAEATADRLRTAVNDTPFAVAEDAGPLEITISIGVAVGGATPFEHARPDRVCRMADGALYAAKTTGRNKVSFAA